MPETEDSQSTTGPALKRSKVFVVTSIVLILLILTIFGVIIVRQHHRATGWVGLLATTDCKPVTAGMPVTIQSGSSGGCVKILQFFFQLGDGHVPGGPPTEDGQFGASTKRYVVEFQNQNGLTPNGMVDQETWTKLDSCIDESAKTIGSIWTCHPLQ